MSKLRIDLGKKAIEKAIEFFEKVLSDIETNNGDHFESQIFVGTIGLSGRMIPINISEAKPFIEKHLIKLSDLKNEIKFKFKALKKEEEK